MFKKWVNNSSKKNEFKNLNSFHSNPMFKKIFSEILLGLPSGEFQAKKKRMSTFIVKKKRKEKKHIKDEILRLLNNLKTILQHNFIYNVTQSNRICLESCKMARNM
jgi:hypothetical protein